MLNWRSLNGALTSWDEEKVWDELQKELAGARRAVIVERLHQRYCVLRNTRERIELMQGLVNAK